MFNYAELILPAGAQPSATTASPPSAAAAPAPATPAAAPAK
jgi:hypothetical protein